MRRHPYARSARARKLHFLVLACAVATPCGALIAAADDLDPSLEVVVLEQVEPGWVAFRLSLPPGDSLRLELWTRDLAAPANVEVNIFDASGTLRPGARKTALGTWDGTAASVHAPADGATFELDTVERQGTTGFGQYIRATLGSTFPRENIVVASVAGTSHGWRFAAGDLRTDGSPDGRIQGLRTGNRTFVASTLQSESALANGHAWVEVLDRATGGGNPYSLGARATVDAASDVNLEGVLMGTFRPGLATPQLIVGPNLLSTGSERDGLEFCPFTCSFMRLAGPDAKAEDEIRFAVTGAGAGLSSTAEVFLAIADVNVAGLVDE